jgi:putative transposase
MRRIDEQYLRTPFYGVQRMAAILSTPNAPVNAKRVRRLMRLMGLEAIYPKPRLSQVNPQHKVYPYLLKELEISKPNQVWCSDITYIRMAKGFIYLVAVMDWFSRYVLSWSVSISLDAAFCCEALELALRQARPEIFNTDQGSQFTSLDFTGILKQAGVVISMDGRGRVFDNIFIERLWRSVKYEEVFLKDYQSVREAIAGLRAYFSFYNNERPHQALDYRTPRQVYFDHSKQPALEWSF